MAEKEGKAKKADKKDKELITEEASKESTLEIVDDLPTDNEDEISVGIEGVKISNEAIATYAGIAISEVQGVYSMAGTFAEALRGRKNLTKGIKIESDAKSAKIDVSIIVEYGARIPEVAFEIQTRVKKSVEAMTGLKVVEVNVHVQGVQKPSKDKE